MSLTDDHHGSECSHLVKPSIFKIKKVQNKNKRRVRKTTTDREWSRDEIVSAFIMSVVAPSHEEAKILEKRLNFYRRKSEINKAFPNIESLVDVFLINHKDIAQKIIFRKEAGESLTSLELDLIKNKMFQYLLSCHVLESLSDQRNFKNLNKLQFNLKYKIDDKGPIVESILGHKNISVQLLVKDYMILKEVCKESRSECSLLDGATACQFLMKKLNRCEEYDVDETETEY